MTSWRPSARTREKSGLTELVVSTVLDRRRASDRKADSEEESSEDKEVANDDELYVGLISACSHSKTMVAFTWILS